MIMIIVMMDYVLQLKCIASTQDCMASMPHDGS
jgi:hypothetical protein